MDFMALPDAGAFRLSNLTAPGCLIGATESLVTLDLTIENGQIIDAPCDHEIDMGRAMVFPAFVDMHTHLDKSQMWNRTPNADGTFEGALEGVNSDKPGRWDAADLFPRMRFALKSAYAHGTRAIRTHLDYFGF